MRAWLLAAALSLVSIAPALAADPLRQGAEAVRDRALTDTTAYDYVASLTTEVGERLAGTDAAARARDWGVAKLKSLGCANVHVEPFTITACVRGPEKAEVVAPRSARPARDRDRRRACRPAARAAAATARRGRSGARAGWPA